LGVSPLPQSHGGRLIAALVIAPIALCRIMLEKSIGIVIALPQEARMFVHGRHDNGKVVRVDELLLVCVSGVGAVRAQSAAQSLLARGASALMSWGVAAALVPELKAGSLLLPHAVISADGAILPVCGTWHRQFREASSPDIRPIAETRSLLASPAQKRELGQTLQAAAADMESAAVARVAQQAQVPFLVVRAVADDFTMSVPTWLMRCMDARGRVHTARLLAQLVRHPRDAIAVARLAHAFSVAQSALSGFKARHLQRSLVII
jgi:adenosylhomocysteine nucleosidase